MGEHADLVHLGVRWLRRVWKCDPVFAEMTTAVSETPDVIGWCRGFSTVVEVKMSRGDFRRDRDKPHARAGYGMGQRRWYLVPPQLLRAEDVPEWCGLAYAPAHARSVDEVQIVKLAPTRERFNFRGEAIMLASAASSACASIARPRAGSRSRHTTRRSPVRDRIRACARRARDVVIAIFVVLAGGGRAVGRGGVRRG